eukprot:scaffold353_cov185-Amphora_coffeaeformis.AAC.75
MVERPESPDQTHGKNHPRMHQRYHDGDHGGYKGVVAHKKGKVELHTTLDFFKGTFVDFFDGRGECLGTEAGVGWVDAQEDRKGAQRVEADAALHSGNP